MLRSYHTEVGSDSSQKKKNIKTWKVLLSVSVIDNIFIIIVDLCEFSILFTWDKKKKS